MSSCGDSNDFIIPKGLDFKFIVQIMEEDSFLPQVLDDFLNGSLTLISLDTMESIVGIPSIPLTKIPEDTIPGIPLVVEETELTIATLGIGEYSITINGTKYSEVYEDIPVSLDAVALALHTKMSVLPIDITATLLNNTITVKETTGGEALISYTDNIAKTAYIAGVEEVEDEQVSTFYNDNGYLQGTIASTITTLLEVSRAELVDDYYLKPLYQGIVQVNFSENTLDKTAIICEIYIIPTGS